MLSEAAESGLSIANSTYDEKQFHFLKVEYYKKQNEYKDLLEKNNALKAKIEMEKSRNDLIDKTRNKSVKKGI